MQTPDTGLLNRPSCDQAPANPVRMEKPLATEPDTRDLLRAMVSHNRTHLRRSLRCRHWRALLFALATAALAGTWTQAQAPPEATVKAALVRRFVDFVEWPSAALPARGPIVLCLSPSQPFGSLIHEVSKGAEGHGRQATIRDLRTGDRPDGCHVLYVARADHDLLARVRNEPVLTVGDDGDFCQIGGIINLQVVDGRVRFEVNLSQARRAGLKVQSQLLRLATRLHGWQP
jgi:hypothetical protein